MLPRRMKAVAVAAAAIAVAGLLPGAGPAQAAGPDLAVSLTCNVGLNRIIARANGNYFANTALDITFYVFDSTYATADGYGGSPNNGNRITLPVTTDPAGAWSVTGYSRAWPAQSYLFYREKVRVTVSNAATGATIGTPHDASCFRDVRTVLHDNCDTDTNAIAISMSGTRYPQPPVLSVRYYQLRSWWQGAPDQPMFVSHPITPDPPFRMVTVRPAADGTWSDPGFSTPGSDGYYGAIEYRVEVWTSGYEPTYQIGRAELICVYADQRP